MANTSLYAGIAQGLSNVADYERERPARDMRMQEAKQRQEQSKFRFEQEQAMAPIKQSEAELRLEQLEGTLKQEKRARLKNETFNAFRQYNADGDTRHMNNFLQTAKSVGDPTWAKWTRFDPMTRTPQVEAMLGQAGYTDLDDYFADPELVKSKVLATDANGEQVLLDLDKIQQGTGYTQQMTTDELKQARERAAIDQLIRGTESAETNIVRKIAEEEGISLLKAYKMYQGAKGTKGGSTIERVAKKLQDEAAGRGETLTTEQALKQAARAQAAPSGAEKDIGVTEGVREKLHALSETGSFYDADLNDPKTREKAGELIVDLEHATGRKLDSATKKAARQMRSLLKLGGVAGKELTEEETGLIDGMLYRVKKYFTDNIEGVEGTTAYNAMRNVQRNALMGATLTAAEIKSFDQAAGTLGQQLGPVLAAMKTSMLDTKEQLQSIVDFEDPMAAKYYLGTSLEQAEIAIDALDERLRHFQSYEKKVAKPLTLKDIKAEQAEQKVKVNIPASQMKTGVQSNADVQATPAGSTPALSPQEFWKRLKGGAPVQPKAGPLDNLPDMSVEDARKVLDMEQTQ